MIELVYPLDPAPFIGPEADASETVPVVDENGLVIGRASREYCHSGAESLLHPVVHLQIVDRFSRFFLQHRSANKETYPNRWDTAVGGHVAYGEFYQEALFREAGEELGLYDFNPQYLDNYISGEPSDREMVGLYVTVGAFDLHPDNYEVSEGRYWTIEEIEAALGKDIFTPEFEAEYKTYKDKILALL
ncbi:MAG: NUDIX domain-containing protein [Bacteroidales bacterium]|nr:NUDIX domain-containing protein [Bacteroidales bacterium]